VMLSGDLTDDSFWAEYIAQEEEVAGWVQKGWSRESAVKWVIYLEQQHQHLLDSSWLSMTQHLLR
jgi:hypothetical protein